MRMKIIIIAEGAQISIHFTQMKMKKNNKKKNIFYDYCIVNCKWKLRYFQCLLYIFSCYPLHCADWLLAEGDRLTKIKIITSLPSKIEKNEIYIRIESYFGLISSCVKMLFKMSGRKILPSNFQWKRKPCFFFHSIKYANIAFL